MITFFLRWGCELQWTHWRVFTICKILISNTWTTGSIMINWLSYYFLCTQKTLISLTDQTFYGNIVWQKHIVLFTMSVLLRVITYKWRYDNLYNINLFSLQINSKERFEKFCKKYISDWWVQCRPLQQKLLGFGLDDFRQIKEYKFT